LCITAELNISTQYCSNKLHTTEIAKISDFSFIGKFNL